MHAHSNQSMTAIWISLVSNVALTIVKLAVGFLYGSQVLVADGVHNAGDVIATAAAFSAMRISKRPADNDHPYGHGKAEVVGSAFVGIVLIIAALVIAYHAVLAFFEPPGQASPIALAAAMLSLVWKQTLYMYTLRVARSAKSKGLFATAYDHLADVYASIAAVAGVALGLFGERYGADWLSYADPLSGIIVAALVLKLAVHIGQEAIDILMEKNVAAARIETYARLVLAVPEVKRLDRLRAREHGHYVLVDVRASVPGSLTIQQGHDIGKLIKQAIRSADPDVDEVLVHLNPWYEAGRGHGP